MTDKKIKATTLELLVDPEKIALWLEMYLDESIKEQPNSIQEHVINELLDCFVISEGDAENGKQE
jgi:hypothetical protein